MKKNKIKYAADLELKWPRNIPRISRRRCESSDDEATVIFLNETIKVWIE